MMHRSLYMLMLYQLSLIGQSLFYVSCIVHMLRTVMRLVFFYWAYKAYRCDLRYIQNQVQVFIDFKSYLLDR
jgi:hypothetical protein